MSPHYRGSRMLRPYQLRAYSHDWVMNYHPACQCPVLVNRDENMPSSCVTVCLALSFSRALASFITICRCGFIQSRGASRFTLGSPSDSVADAQAQIAEDADKTAWLGEKKLTSTQRHKARIGVNEHLNCNSETGIESPFFVPVYTDHSHIYVLFF